MALITGIWCRPTVHQVDNLKREDHLFHRELILENLGTAHVKGATMGDRLSLKFEQVARVSGLPDEVRCHLAYEYELIWKCTWLVNTDPKTRGIKMRLVTGLAYRPKVMLPA